MVAFFIENFNHRKGFDKVRFFGDAHLECVGRKYDFCYCDIYPTLLGNETLEDEMFFTRENEIGEYLFWGEELAWYLAYQEEVVEGHAVPDDITAFFQMFEEVTEDILRAPLDGTNNEEFLTRFVDIKLRSV